MTAYPDFQPPMSNDLLDYDWLQMSDQRASHQSKHGADNAHSEPIPVKFYTLSHPQLKG